MLEDAVRQTILEHSGGLPIVSVSQEPLDFGDNICVGDIGRSRHNIYRQLRLGLQRAQSRFVVVCEADFLYPPAFFQFNPEREDTYYYPREGYILWKNRRNFKHKTMRELSGIVNREHLDKLIRIAQELDTGFRRRWHFTTFMQVATRMEVYDAGPVVTLKTDRSMNRHSPAQREGPLQLPIWGRRMNVWRRYKCQ